MVEKKRDLKKKHRSSAIDLYGSVKDKRVILVDDVITSGGTLINAARLCLQRGAKEVYGVVTHHDFSPNAILAIKNSPISKIFTTNTIELQAQQQSTKLEEISIAPLIAEELK